MWFSPVNSLNNKNKYKLYLKFPELRAQVYNPNPLYPKYFLSYPNLLLLIVLDVVCLVTNIS